MINTEQWKVGIYCRLSKEDELDDTSKSIISQKEVCLKYITDNGLYLVDTYIDDGISGTLEERDGFDRMMRDIDLKKINMVIVKDTSRLARNSEMCTKYAFEIFPQKKVRFVIPGFYDSLKPDNNDNIYFKSFFDEWYVRDTSNKIRKVFNTKRELGQFIGGTAPYGYNKDPNNKNMLVIDEYSSEIVKRIFEMSANGYGLTRICRVLDKEQIPIPSIYKNLNRGQKSICYGKWCPRTIRDMLANETYIGNLTQGRGKKLNYKSKKKIRTPKSEWIIVKNSCPRIIDDETWNMVQQIYDKNKNIQRKTHKQLFKGFLYCKECNHTIGIVLSQWKDKNNIEHKKYYCYCNYYKKYSRDGICTSHKIDYEELEKNILKDMRKECRKHLKITNLENALKNSNKLTKVLNQLTTRKNFLLNEIEIFSKRTTDIYMDKIKNKITDEIFNSTYNRLVLENNTNKKELEEVEEKIYKLKNNVVSDDKYKSVIEEFLKFRKPSRQLIASLIDKIVIDKDGNIEIYKKFRSNY